MFKPVFHLIETEHTKINEWEIIIDVGTDTRSERLSKQRKRMQFCGGMRPRTMSKLLD